MEDEKIMLSFSEGFYELRENDYLAVEGKGMISIEGWDLDQSICLIQLEITESFQAKSTGLMLLSKNFPYGFRNHG